MLSQAAGFVNHRGEKSFFLQLRSIRGGEWHFIQIAQKQGVTPLKYK